MKTVPLPKTKARDSWQETLAIRAVPSLMREIRRGLRVLRHTQKLYTLDELFEKTHR